MNTLALSRNTGRRLSDVVFDTGFERAGAVVFDAGLPSKRSRGDGGAAVLQSLGDLIVQRDEDLEIAYEEKAWKALVFGAEGCAL